MPTLAKYLIWSEDLSNLTHASCTNNIGSRHNMTTPQMKPQPSRACTQNSPEITCGKSQVFDIDGACVVVFHFRQHSSCCSSSILSCIATHISSCRGTCQLRCWGIGGQAGEGPPSLRSICSEDVGRGPFQVDGHMLISLIC